MEMEEDARDREMEDERAKVSKRSISGRKKRDGRREKKEKGDGWSTRGMIRASHLSHTHTHRCLGKRKEQEEDRGENKEAGKVKDTTSEQEMKKR